MAARLGFDGVELPASRDSSIASSTNALLTAPEKIRRIFSDADVEISSLNIGSDAAELPERILLAAELNCRVIRLQDDAMFSRSQKITTRAINRLRDCADTAAAAGVTLLIENMPVKGSALVMWHLLDRIDSPAVACCWNTAAAAVAGDSPAVAVPTLNTRIHCVRLPEVQSEALAIRKTLDRLRGIGFSQWLIVGPANHPARTNEELEQSLVKAKETLRSQQIQSVTVA